MGGAQREMRTINNIHWVLVRRGHYITGGSDYIDLGPANKDHKPAAQKFAAPVVSLLLTAIFEWIMLTGAEEKSAREVARFQRETYACYVPNMLRLRWSPVCCATINNQEASQSDVTPTHYHHFTPKRHGTQR